MKGTTVTAPYASLPMGEDFIMIAEDNEGTIPVDLSKESLRGYSPFVLSVNAPDMKYGTNRTGRRPFTQPISSSLSRPFVSGVSTLAPVLSSYAPRPISAQGQVSVSPNEEAGFTTREQLKDIAIQMDHLDNLPPIIFLINPTSFNQEYSSIQAFQEQSRYGFIFQRWGEDLEKLSFTCRIGAFISGRRDPNSQGISGLQYVSRRDSAGFRQLQSILAVYRNSSAIYDRLGKSRAYHAVGTQSIHYDGQEWEGRITSFSYGMDESQQHGNLEFSFEFTAFRHFYRDFNFKSVIEPMYNPSSGVN